MSELNQINITSPKPFVFVLMPFDKSYDDLYRLGIKPACDAAGAYCERVDEQLYDGSMLERIYNQINVADVIIAVMNERNPNVFYEVGYAHALGKKVILMTSNAEDIPFDLKHHYHIVYSSINEISDELSRRVSWVSKHSLHHDEAHLGSPLDFYINGVRLLDGYTYDQHVSIFDNVINIGVALKNSSGSPYNTRSDEFCIVVPIILESGISGPSPKNTENLIQISENENMLSWQGDGWINPHAWSNIEERFTVRNEDSLIRVEFRQYSRYGFESREFFINIVSHAGL